MYADDTNVTFAASNMIDFESQTNTELKSIDLRANKSMSLKLSLWSLARAKNCTI